jgi:hypothetical protein
VGLVSVTTPRRSAALARPLNAQDGAAGDSLDGGNGPDVCMTDAGDVKINCP